MVSTCRSPTFLTDIRNWQEIRLFVSLKLCSYWTRRNVKVPSLEIAFTASKVIKLSFLSCLFSIETNFNTQNLNQNQLMLHQSNNAIRFVRLKPIRFEISLQWSTKQQWSILCLLFLSKLPSDQFLLDH